MRIDSQIRFRKKEVDNFEDIKSLLTLKNPEYETKLKHAYSSRAVEGVPKTLCFVEEEGDLYSIPRNFPINTLHKYISDERVDGDPSNGYTFEGVLRDYQENYIEDEGLETAFRSSSDFVMQVPCGHGKSIMALYLFAKYARKALVLVPRNTLAKQWMEYAKKYTPSARVVKFTTKEDPDTFDTKKVDIVVMTLELFKLRDFPIEFYEQFGIVALDEAHRVGAPTYHPIIDRLPGRLRMALSATFRRKDNMQQILRYHFGESAVMDNKFPLAQLLPVKTNIKLSPDDNSKVYSRGTLSFTRLDTLIAEHGWRNKMIFAMLLKLVLNKQRTVIFLSKRRAILETFNSMMLKRGIESYLIVGGSGDIPEEVKQSCQVFFGIMQLAEEGIDIERADTLVLHQPIGDIEQAAGRIRRTMEGKKKPLVLWPYDDIAPYKKMYDKACKFTDVVSAKSPQDIITFTQNL